MANFITNEFIPIAVSYPAGWLLCSALVYIYYRKAKLGRSRLVNGPEPERE